MHELTQSQTAEPLTFLMIDSLLHIAGKEGLSPTVTLSKNGGSFASPAGAVSEIGKGWYQVAGNATDTDTLGPLILHAEAAGADPVDREYQIVKQNRRNASMDLVVAKATNVTGFNDIAATAIVSGGAITTSGGQVSNVGTVTNPVTTVESNAILSGTVNTVTDPGDFTLTSSELSTNDNDYNGMWLVFTNGSNKGVCRVIGTYTGTTKQVQFPGTGRSAAFPQTVTPGDSFLILAGIP